MPAATPSDSAPQDSKRVDGHQLFTMFSIEQRI
jgi:hypothetical protein